MNDPEQKQQKMLEIWFNEMWEPGQWLCSASIMKQAADILFSCCEAKEAGGKLKNPECINMDIPATLLYGYAMENVIKALVIKQKPKEGSDYIEYKGYSGWSGHNLVPLLKLVKFELNRNEQHFLDTLSAYINWAGKYPVTFKRENFLISGPCIDQSLEAAKDSIPEPLDKLKRGELDLLFKRILNECKDDKS